MAALTQEEWFRKLKSWVPSWWFEQERYQVAVFHAIAKVLSEVQDQADEHVQQTFIAQALAPFLDAHGDERSVDRLTDEIDSVYSPRIRNIVNRSNKIAIKAMVDELLLTGECLVIENPDDGPIFGGSFCDRREIFTDRRYDGYFTVLIPRQIALANSYCDRTTFASRGNYAGSLGPLPLESLLSSINTLIFRAKAGGILYRLIEE
jgi:hypothetical protein